MLGIEFPNIHEVFPNIIIGFQYIEVIEPAELIRTFSDEAPDRKKKCVGRKDKKLKSTQDKWTLKDAGS